MYTLTVKADGIREVQLQLDALTQGIPPHQVNAAVAPMVGDLTRHHLYDLADARHRDNVGVNFYAHAADSVKYVDLDNGAEVRIDWAGIAQRYYGGDIKAVNYSYLWIPVDPESEGKTAGSFHGLVAIVNKMTNRGVGIMPGPDPKTGKPSVKYGHVLFALVPELHQDPDPSVLPTDAEYSESVGTAIDDLLFTLNDLAGGAR